MVALAQTLFSQGAPWAFRLIEGVDFSPLRGMSVGYEGSLMTAETMLIAVGCTCKCLVYYSNDACHVHMAGVRDGNTVTISGGG